MTKEKLNAKLNLTENVRQRVKGLGENALKVLGVALEKLTKIEGKYCLSVILQ